MTKRERKAECFLPQCACRAFHGPHGSLYRSFIFGMTSEFTLVLFGPRTLCRTLLCFLPSTTTPTICHLIFSMDLSCCNLCPAHIEFFQTVTRSKQKNLLNVLDAVGQAGAGFRSLADPMIDTTSPHGKLILAVLAALAEFERSMILARTSEGRSRAMARGVRFGRKRKLSRFQIEEALARRAQGETTTEIAKSYNCSHSTISRLQASP